MAFPAPIGLCFSRMCLGEKDSGDVSGAVQDVKYVNALGVPGDTVENLVAAVNAMSHASIFVTRHERVGEGHVCEAHALVTQLSNEAQSTSWIVAGDVAADGLKLRLGVKKAQRRWIVHDHATIRGEKARSQGAG